MPYVIDLTGEEYPLKATITNDGEVNGNQILSATIEFNDVNNVFIRNIAELWRIVDHDDVEHVIKYCRRRGVGDKMAVDIKGVPVFFDRLDNDRIYERIDKHMTANEAFTRIFEGTGFTFVLTDAFAAVAWEGFGDGETKLETFKRAIERYKCEFEIIGNTVYLRSQIGRDTSIMYRHRLNASNIVQEIDANELWTFARGYGDYGDGEGGEDWRDAKLIREYTSPLANILGIRHAPPIKNGNIKDPAFMDAQLKTLVDESLKISVSATIHDLRKQGYPYAQSQLGDRVFLIDERIGLNEEVRVVAQSITRDWKGNVIDINITFGSHGITKRHQASMQTALKNITDLLEGRKKLPFDVLDNAVMEATKALKSAQTELEFNNGILARDKNDPNKIVIFNSAGLGISVDGGNSVKSAITANGIVADVITGGTLRGIVIEGVEIYGSTLISELAGDPSTYTRIEGSTIWNRGRYERTWKGETRIINSQVQLANGYLRFSDIDRDAHLGFSSNGISTYLTGDGEGRASGTIEFFSQRYGLPGQVGITVTSNYGVIALETGGVFGGDIIFNPRDGYVVEARGPLRVRREIRSIQDRITLIAADNDTHYNFGIAYDSVNRKHPSLYPTLNDTGYLGLSNSYLRGAYINNISYETLTQKSSRNLKENIVEIDKHRMSALLKDLKIYSFNYKTAKDYSTVQKHIGVIAEESPEEILSVNGDSVVISNLLGVAICAIQELQERVSYLEGGTNE